MAEDRIGVGPPVPSLATGRPCQRRDRSRRGRRRSRRARHGRIQRQPRQRGAPIALPGTRRSLGPAKTRIRFRRPATTRIGRLLRRRSTRPRETRIRRRLAMPRTGRLLRRRGPGPGKARVRRRLAETRIDVFATNGSLGPAEIRSRRRRPWRRPWPRPAPGVTARPASRIPDRPPGQIPDRPPPGATRAPADHGRARPGHCGPGHGPVRRERSARDHDRRAHCARARVRRDRPGHSGDRPVPPCPGPGGCGSRGAPCFPGPGPRRGPGPGRGRSRRSDLPGAPGRGDETPSGLAGRPPLRYENHSRSSSSPKPPPLWSHSWSNWLALGLLAGWAERPEERWPRSSGRADARGGATAWATEEPPGAGAHCSDWSGPPQPPSCQPASCHGCAPSPSWDQASSSCVACPDRWSCCPCGHLLLMK